LPATPPRVTLRDVARTANVHPSLVSRVLSQDPRARVSAHTRRRILSAAQRLGYHPNALARGLRLATPRTLGLLLPDLGNPIYDQVVRGAYAAATAEGYVLVIGSTYNDQATELAFADLLHQGRVDGLIITSATLDSTTVARLAATALPVVVANRQVEGALASVIVDDEAASSLATNHLLDLGHIHLAHIAGAENAETSARRISGFTTAARIRAQSALILRAGTRPVDGYSAALEIISAHPEVTGIVCASFRAAAGVLHAAAVRRRTVPDRLSVVAIHDDLLADHLLPPLTTIELPMRELGSAAVQMLLGRIAGNSPEQRTVPDPPRLHIRESTAPPNYPPLEHSPLQSADRYHRAST